MKIVIRRAEPGDFDAVAKLFEGAQAVAGTLQLPMPLTESWRKAHADAGSDTRLVAVVEKRIVGQISLHPVPRPRRAHAAVIGMTVDDRWQGRGVGTALMRAAIDLADNWLGLLRLELTVFTDNAAAVHLYEKCGFVIEGTHRAFALRNGEFVDAYAMARIHPRPPAAGLATAKAARRGERAKVERAKTKRTSVSRRP